MQHVEARCPPLRRCDVAECRPSANEDKLGMAESMPWVSLTGIQFDAVGKGFSEPGVAGKNEAGTMIAPDGENPSPSLECGCFCALDTKGCQFRISCLS